MFLLATLLAAADDAATATARRAATHELARRLGRPMGPPPGGFRGRLEAWLRRHPGATEWLTKRERVWSALTDLLHHAGAHGLTWTREEDLPTPGIVTTLDGSIAWWLNVLWALEPPPGAYGEHGVYARRGPQEHTLLEVAYWIEA